MTKKLAGALIAVAFFVSPLLSSAQTTNTSTSVQVQALLTQIQALQAQIQAVKTAQAQLGTATANVSSTLSLIRNLRQGMSGEDVAALQAILAADTTIYPEGTISGFYGRLTAEAVKKYQKKHGIETLGVVGPKTLKKLNESIKELGLSNDNNEDGDDDKSNIGRAKKLCAKVPPGHLIAPGWLKKNNGEKPIVPECQKLPPGIVNNGGNAGGGNSTTTPDTTAPVISAVGTSNLLGTTTNIVWTTNEASNSKIWFSTTSPVSTLGTANVTNASLVTNHLLSLSGLATSTTYFYVVTSADATGNTGTSSQASFVTTAGL